MSVEILAVDDNPANLRSLQALLGGAGATVVEAHSGDEALWKLLERDVALILLDIQMPDMDGYETARLIRSRERSKGTPIIFVTAYHRTEEHILQGYALGAVDFLYKPIIPEILRAKVAFFLELHQKTLETRRQGELLRLAERREHERALQEERQKYERALLKSEMERERRVAEQLSQRAEELTRLVEEKEAAQRAQVIAAQERARLIDELKESDRRKDEFLAMLGHELRNPLVPIRNSLEVFRARAAGDAVLQRAIGAAERQVRHMIRLVDDLLDVSRITRGKVELRRERVDLAQVLEQALNASESIVRQRQHTLTLALPEKPVLVDADPSRLAQIIANLLQNAAKYTEPGGKIHFSAELEGPELVIRVKDSGIGIRADMLTRIFDLFVQDEPTSDRALGGLGLGLTLVKSLVELHGGTVHASSAGAGQGSEFVVRMPLSPQGAEAAAPPAPGPQAPVNGTHPDGKLNILLVDDNPDIRMTMRDLLELHGHQVLEATDGVTAVEMVLRQRPHVALVDIGLPGIDGYRVAELVRSSVGGAAATRLIALTGYGAEEARRRALASGFDAHLVKPISTDELWLLLDRLR